MKTHDTCVGCKAHLEPGRKVPLCDTCLAVKRARTKQGYQHDPDDAKVRPAFNESAWLAWKAQQTSRDSEPETEAQMLARAYEDAWKGAR